MKTFVKDHLMVRQYESRSSMGAEAAKSVGECIRKELGTHDHINMIFAAAPSQNEMLQNLIRQDVDWSRVNAFHMDEYTGLPPGASQTFRHYLDEHLFSHVAFKKVNYINGNADDLNEECSRYSDLLKKFPPDIVCMGIGENGHLAFNDPHVAFFNDSVLVKVVDLDEVSRQQQVNDGCFATIDVVPSQALTLTIPALMSGRNIFCVVPGKKKAAAVHNTLNQSVDEKFPSTILRTHSNAILFVDEDSYQQ